MVGLESICPRDRRNRQEWLISGVFASIFAKIDKISWFRVYLPPVFAEIDKISWFRVYLFPWQIAVFPEISIL